MSTNPKYIILNGTDTLEQKQTAINTIYNTYGKEQWVELFKKNPSILSATDSVVILNDVLANLDFEFEIIGGIYDVILRVIAPSANSDSGFYVLDAMPVPYCWQLGLGPTKYLTKIYTLNLLTNLPLVAGKHNLNLLYREPIGIIDVKIQNKKTTENIVMKALDIVNKESIRRYMVPSSKQACDTKPYSSESNPSPSSFVIPTSSGIQPSAADLQANTAPVVVPLAAPPVIVLAPPSTTPGPVENVVVGQYSTSLGPVVESPAAPSQPQIITSPGPQPTTSSPLPLYEATGTSKQYATDNFYVLVFEGNGTLKFNRQTRLNVVAVAGGGGGEGGTMEIISQDQGVALLKGGSGGEGGANIMCDLTAGQFVQYDVVVGQKGASGVAGSPGGNGGDTILSVGGVNYIVCRGGAGGRNSSPQSSSYMIDSTYVSNIQAGGVAANTPGQGGVGGGAGMAETGRGRPGVPAAAGTNSATYNSPFNNVPVEIGHLVYIYYGGGGGGGGDGGSGGAGEGSGGKKYDNNIGESAKVFGAGGGGALGRSVGGYGGSGVMIFFFPKSETTATSSSLSMITVTPTQTTKSPVYMTTTISPLPFLGMTVWLVASTMATATTNTNWKNNAPSATSDGSNLGKLFSNAYNATIFNGSPGLNLASGNAIYTVQMPKNNSPTGLTVFVVFRPVANNSTYVGLVSRNTDKYPAPFDMYNNQRAIGDGSTTNYKFITSSVDLKKLALNTNYLFVFRIAVSATKTSTVSEWLNGKPSTLSPISVPVYGDNSTNFYIGSRADKATLFSGYIGEVIYYNRPLSDVEVASATTYLNSKYKIF